MKKFFKIIIAISLTIILAFSAYAFIPPVNNWVNSIAGLQGEQGLPGVDGKDGINGTDGNDGLSAYELAVANGFEGSVDEWLLSLVGDSSNNVIYQHNIVISAGAGSGYNTRIYLTILNSSASSIVTLVDLIEVLPEGSSDTIAYPCSGFYTTNFIAGLYVYDKDSHLIRIVTGVSSSTTNIPLQQLLIVDNVLILS